MCGDDKGLIFNTVHGSFVDGYGIRTTIFLKGCPLKCVWCCNPEGQSFKQELKVMHSRCNGCGRCLNVCDRGAITLNGTDLKIDREKCDACQKCTQVCYTDALEPFGEWRTVDDVFQEVVKDVKYYSATGGGLTIGGGEATCFPDFVLSLIEKCHEHGIKVAVDTCGYIVAEENFRCLCEADLVLFDIKGIDSELHRKNTGQSNEIIWENLHRLNVMGKPIIIRLPLIPGYNDSLDKLEEIADRLEPLAAIERIDILPVHEYGKSKYEQLGMPYLLKSEPIEKARQEEILEYFISRGFSAQIGG